MNSAKISQSRVLLPPTLLPSHVKLQLLGPHATPQSPRRKSTQREQVPERAVVCEDDSRLSRAPRRRGAAGLQAEACGHWSGLRVPALLARAPLQLAVGGPHPTAGGSTLLWASQEAGNTGRDNMAIPTAPQRKDNTGTRDGCVSTVREKDMGMQTLPIARPQPRTLLPHLCE